MAVVYLLHPPGYELGQVLFLLEPKHDHLRYTDGKIPVVLYLNWAIVAHGDVVPPVADPGLVVQSYSVPVVVVILGVAGEHAAVDHAVAEIRDHG